MPPSLPRATGNTPSRTLASAQGQLTRPRLGGSADRITRPRARSVAPGRCLAAGVGEAEEASEGHVQPAEGRAARAKANPGVGELGRHVMPACQESRFIDLQTAATPLWWEHPQATGNPKAPRYTEREAPLARPRAPRARSRVDLLDRPRLSGEPPIPVNGAAPAKCSRGGVFEFWRGA